MWFKKEEILPTIADSPLVCEECGCLISPGREHKVSLNGIIRQFTLLFCGTCKPPYVSITSDLNQITGKEEYKYFKLVECDKDGKIIK